MHHATEPRAIAVVTGATAVPHRFYRAYAADLADRGYETVTYDYRGIGDSAPDRLRGFEASLTDWALSDLAGVLDWAARRHDRIFLVGHSFGGQVAGLLEDAGRVAAMVTISSQSGHWRLQGGEQKLIVAAHVFFTIPVLATVLGYLPWSRFAAGEDLPKQAALQWARWCRDRRYVMSDGSLPLERYEEFSAPVLAFSFSDDKWGTARSVDAMMDAYPNVERRHVSPGDLGGQRIGHMGFFRPSSRLLWDDVFAWFESS